MVIGRDRLLNLDRSITLAVCVLTQSRNLVGRNSTTRRASSEYDLADHRASDRQLSNVDYDARDPFRHKAPMYVLKVVARMRATTI